MRVRLWTLYQAITLKAFETTAKQILLKWRCLFDVLPLSIYLFLSFSVPFCLPALFWLTSQLGRDKSIIGHSFLFKILFGVPIQTIKRDS